jgi:hypothetical protein
MTTFASRADWLAARSKPAPDGGPMLGASDVATPFGLGFTSPARAAAILRGDLPRDPEPDTPSDPRAVGTRLEHVALAEYAVHHRPAGAWPLADQITRWLHPDRPWLAVSPDALAIDSVGSDVTGLVEVKIPRSAGALSEYAPDAPDGYGIAATLADPRGPAIPRRYALQVLAQLATIRAVQTNAYAPGYVPALTYCDLWVWAGPHAHRRVRLVWDDGAQAAADSLFDAVAAWRQRHVLDGEPVPVGCPDDAAVAVRLWRAEGLHSAPGLARTAADYAVAAEDAKRAEARKDAAKAALLGALYRAGASTALIPDPHADPGAKTRAAREGRPAKVAITGTPGGVRSLRVTPGWLADAALPGLAADVAAPIEPIHVPGVTVGELAARWADAPTAPATDTPQAADPVLAAALAAMASDDGADW